MKMGYSHFDDDEEIIMTALLRENVRRDDVKGYPLHIKSLLRKKMIMRHSNYYVITDRGRNAIIQQKRSGEYWVSPLHPKKFNPYGTLKISRELSNYVR
jgi:hypothetical protein